MHLFNWQRFYNKEILFAIVHQYQVISSWQAHMDYFPFPFYLFKLPPSFLAEKTLRDIF